MLISEKNETGIIGINALAVSQIIQDAVKLRSRCLQLLPEKEIEYSDKGVRVVLHVSMKFGESISEVCGVISDRINELITESLESDVDDIIICIDQIYTTKTKVKRNITYSFKNEKRRKRDKS